MRLWRESSCEWFPQAAVRERMLLPLGSGTSQHERGRALHQCATDPVPHMERQALLKRTNALAALAKTWRLQ